MPKVRFSVNHGAYLLTKDETDDIFEEGKPVLTKLEKSLKEKLEGARLHCHQQKRTAKPESLSKKLNKTHWIIFYCECKKEFKIEYTLPITEDGLTVVVKKPIQEECECATLPPRLEPICGAARTELKKKLTLAPASEVCKQIYDKPRKPGDLEGVVPLTTAHKAAQEKRAEHDLAVDPVTDVQMRRRQGKLSNLAEVSDYRSETDKKPRFRMILTTDGLINVTEKFLKDRQLTFKRLLLDATGKITKKVNEDHELLHHVLLAPIPKKDSDECYLVPVGEMVSDDGTGKNIAYFLDFILSQISPGALKRLNQIGTDDSWANIHGILKLSDTNINEFLSLSYTAFYSNGADIPPKLLTIVSPGLCYSHISKNWKKDLDRNYEDDKDTKRSIKACFAALTTITEPEKLDQHLKALLVLLASKFQSANYKAAHKKLSTLHGFQPDDNQGSQDNEILDDIATREPSGIIFRDSPFWQHFNGFIEEQNKIPSSSKCLTANKFFNVEFLNKFLKHYVSVLPLWTVFVSRLIDENAKRNNNGRIESSFQKLKDSCAANRLEIGPLASIKVLSLYFTEILFI